MSDESHFDIYNIQKILRQWDMPKISSDFYLEGNAFFNFFSYLSQLIFRYLMKSCQSDQVATNHHDRSELA